MKRVQYFLFSWSSVPLRWLVCITIGSGLLITCRSKEPEPLTPTANFRLTADNCMAPCDPGFVNLSQYPESYLWEFGDGTTSTEETPRHSFTNGGQYPVKLTVTGSENRTDDTTVTITVQAPAPIAAFTIQNNNCTAPCEVSFQNQSQNAQSYRWEFGSGGTATEANPKHTYTRGGTYEVKLTATGARNLTNTKTQTVTIQQPVPVADFLIENDNCIAPCTVVLRNQSQNATSYSWKINSSFASNGAAQYRTTTEANPAQAYANAGFWLAGSAGFGIRLAYGAELTVTGPGGTRTIEKIIRIRPPIPKASFTYRSASISVGNGFVFTDTSTPVGGLTYRWNFGDTKESTEVSPTHYFNAGTYRVTLFVTNETGTGIAQQSIQATIGPR